jgi:hypothetical protein
MNRKSKIRQPQPTKTILGFQIEDYPKVELRAEVGRRCMNQLSSEPQNKIYFFYGKLFIWDRRGGSGVESLENTTVCDVMEVWKWIFRASGAWCRRVVLLYCWVVEFFVTPEINIADFPFTPPFGYPVLWFIVVSCVFFSFAPADLTYRTVPACRTTCFVLSCFVFYLFLCLVSWNYFSAATQITSISEILLHLRFKTNTKIF